MGHLLCAVDARDIVVIKTTKAFVFTDARGVDLEAAIIKVGQGRTFW